MSQVNTPEEKIINKIIKLLALSTSPNEKEAASALNKARIMLTKYGFEISDLETKIAEVSEKELLKCKNITDWQIKLISCVTDSTYTEAIITAESKTKKIILIGRKPNIITAIHLFEYLHTSIKKISIKYKMVVRDLDSFRLGMVENIKDRLRELNKTSIQSNGKDLITLMKKETTIENKIYRKNKYGEIGNKEFNKSIESNSYGLGKIIGEKISLNTQIDKIKYK